MKKMFLGVGLTALLLGGCSKVSPEATASVDTGPSKTTDSNPPAESANPKTEPTPKVAGADNSGGSAVAKSDPNPNFYKSPGFGVPKDAPEPTAAERARVEQAVWGPSAVSPEELAQSVDGRIASLKNSAADIKVNFRTKDFSGVSQCTVAIRDAKTFHIEYPVVGGKTYRLAKATEVADGVNMTEINGDGLQPVKPVSSYPVTSMVPIPKWRISFPTLIFSSLVGGHPLTQLMAELRKDKTCTVRVEERKFEFKGKEIVQRQMLVHGMVDSKPLDISILVDVNHMLPVTILAVANKDVGKEEWTMWEAKFNVHPDKPFADDLFVVPHPS